MNSFITKHHNIVAYDNDWQFPAITEQHAFHQMRAFGGVPDGTTYVAFPWATLIDTVHRNAPDAQRLLETFTEFCEVLPTRTTKITVCQHILMRRYLHLFQACGISDIFWTHTTQQDVETPAPNQPTLHPFPLYPIQATEPPEQDTERTHLFSFIGAPSNEFYLTQCRNWIFEHLSEDPRGVIVRRDGCHYQKIVYDHQVAKATPRAKPDRLIAQSHSEQFKHTLRNSIFSLCPSGSGPNSIRLWESIASGSIPVILSETYALPGNPRLWEQAAVRCAENPKAIRALPDQLEHLAKDPERLAAMRHGLRQLSLLYGKACFVYDIHTYMLRQSDRRAGASRSSAGESAAMRRLVAATAASETLSQQEAVLWLRMLSSKLLIDKHRPKDDVVDRSAVDGLVRKAQQALPRSHPAVVHFNKVQTVAAAAHTAATRTTRQQQKRPIKICFFGRHANRTPLSYPPFQRVAGGRIEIVTDPHQADVLMTGHNADLREAGASLAALLKARPNTQVVVLSEEPLWDTLWSGGFVQQKRALALQDVEINYTFLNYINCKALAFDSIPYFLLTNDEYLVRYRFAIARFTQLSEQQLLEHWRRAPVKTAFFAEYREGPQYDQVFAAHGIVGLSTFRTEVARQLGGPGVLRVGKHWETKKPRQELADWHLDKLATLMGRTRALSALENTHLRDYISEKIFDAYAVGAIPLYYAAPDHRLFDVVSETGLINVFGLSAQAAAEKVRDFVPDRDFAGTWLRTARELERRFSNTALITRERCRMVDSIVLELELL